MNGAIRVCFPFVGDDFGGSHVSAVKLIQGFDRSRVEPIVVLQAASGPLADYLQRRHVPYSVLPDLALLTPSWRTTTGAARSPSLWSYVRRSVPLMRSYLRKSGSDIVHTNDGRIHASWAFAARAAGRKVVWHHRADPAARGVNVLAPVLAHHILSVSHFACPRRPVAPIGHKLSVVRSPFDLPGVLPDRRAARSGLLAEIGAAPETRILGYFGAFVDRKRPVGFVEAVHAFASRHPHVPVAGVLFGERALGGPPLDLAVLERARALGIADRIHLLGFRDPVDRWMSAVDALLVPAVNEPFGRTLIEAMLLGTPVVATRHGGNVEAIRDGVTGFLVEPETPEAFVEPVHALVTEPEVWERVSGTAQAEARSAYSVDRHVEEVTRLYASLLGRSALRLPPI